MEKIEFDFYNIIDQTRYTMAAVTKGIKRQLIIDLIENRNKYHRSVSEAIEILNKIEYNILRQQILSPIDLPNTYIGVLPNNILHNYLYQYINFSLTYFEESIVCPHGHYVKPDRVYGYEQYRLVYCHCCNSGYVFIKNPLFITDYTKYLHDCLFVVKYICRKPFCYQKNINNNNSYRMEFQYNHHYTITAILDSNIIEFDIHT